MYHSALYLLAGKPVIAPEGVQYARRTTCQNCPHYRAMQCGLCDCLVNLKVMLSAEACPDNPARWSAVAPRGEDWDEA